MSSEQAEKTDTSQQDVADKLNKGLSSAWGWFSKATDAVKETGSKLAAELPGKMDKALETLKAMEDAPQEKNAAPTTCPWDEAPGTWKPEDWAAFSKALVEDESTFLLGPDRGMTQDEARALRAYGVSVDFTIEKDDDYTAKVSKEMLDYEPLGTMRFNLVPKYVREEVFWRNYFWKLRELGKLEGVANLASVVKILNTQRSDIPEDWKGTDLKRGLPDAVTDPTKREERIAKILSFQDKEPLSTEDKKSGVRAMYEEGVEALMLLKECLNDPDMVEHLKVACDTCVSCREKLQKDIEEHGGEGEDFTKTLTLIGELDDAIRAFETKTARPSPGPSPVSAADDDKCSSNVDSFVEVPRNPQSEEKLDAETRASPVPSSEPSATATAQKDFSALPWDSDESD